MDDKRPIHSLDDIFNDPDSATLLVTKKRPTVNSFNPDVEKFKEVQEWIKNHGGKEPEKTGDICRLHERGLASWLIGVRGDADRIELLKPYDELGLLKEKSQEISNQEKIKHEKMNFDSLDEILNDDSVLFSSDNQKSLNAKLFNTRKLKEIRREQENIPKNKSKRKKMDNFGKYKSLFDQIHADLASGRRKIVPYEENGVSLHRFYILNGQLIYIESIGSNFQNKTRSASKTNARLHVIYDNGTENYPLRNGLIASLYGSRKRHGYGKAISEPNDKFEFESDDQVTGYIYVLRSLSKNADVRRIQEDHPLYKVGFTSGTVEHRIVNAENESTYLYGPVKVVAEYQVINLNPEALETALHHALARYRLEVDIKAANGKTIHPREWFIADFDTINNLINEIISKLRISTDKS